MALAGEGRGVTCLSIYTCIVCIELSMGLTECDIFVKYEFASQTKNF